MKKTQSPPAATADADADPDAWRHPPRPADDESPAESLGRAVSDVVTGPLDDASDDPAPGERR